MNDVVIIGGGPAGLTAAYQLSKQGHQTTVIEQDSVVGGLSRTVNYKGFRFDIGGHRFFTKIPEVRQIWRELLSEEFLKRPRLSRIYYQNQFFQYPLQPFDALRKLGPVEALRILGSYCHARVRPTAEEASFEQWVSNRFGHRLYEMFFKTYTEKVWGIPGSEISADWASQRIQNLSLLVAISNAIFRSKDQGLVKTLIEQFEYPRFGPGQMWERCRDVVQEKGHALLMGRRVMKIAHDGRRIRSLTTVTEDGRVEQHPTRQVISSMSLRELVQSLDPAPPDEVQRAAERLRYRDFLTVGLVIDRPDLFADNWIYVHSPEVRVGRIQNFKNWSPEMVPDPSRTCLGLEYFVWEGNDLWSMPDPQLLDLAAKELALLRLVDPTDIEDGSVVRMRKAYPVYDGNYRESLGTVRAYLSIFPNLQQVGRNGQHRYNNQDHSMMTALLAAENLGGATHDIWNVNADDEYHETVGRTQPQRAMRRAAVAPKAAI